MAHPLIRSLCTVYVFTTMMFPEKSLTIWLRSCNQTLAESYSSVHSRGFLQGSKEFADGIAIGRLANELSLRFSAPVEITIEFEKMSKEEIDQESFKLPSSNALPITGPD